MIRRSQTNQNVPSTLNEKEEDKMNSQVQEKEKEQKLILTLIQAFLEVRNVFKKFIYFTSPDDYILASLYTLLSRSYHEMDKVPYVYLYGPPNTGKSRVLKLFKILGLNSKLVVRTSNAALKRIFKKKMFFLLDEADILGKPEGSYMLPVFLNGYENGGVASVCAKGTQEVIDYPVFGLKAFATTTWIKHPALVSRCIIMRMMMPDPKNRPQKFHFATDGKALEELERRITELFEKTNVTERIMEAYLNLEEIEEAWGRNDELLSGMRAIAQNISKQLDDRLVEIAKKRVEEGRSEDFFDNLDIQKLAAVASFVRARKLDEDPNSYVIAEKLRDNVALRLRLSRSFRTESLGKLLRAYFLLKKVDGPNPKVMRVPWKTKIFPKNLAQKSCYFIDYARLNTFMDQYKGLIEEPEPETPRPYSPTSGSSDLGRPPEAEDLEDEENYGEEVGQEEDGPDKDL